VPPERTTQEAVATWRESFRRADQLPEDASAAARRTRGKDFERILHGLFAEANLEPRTSYRPVGEEIDGSFIHNFRPFLLEAKWTKDALPASAIYQFRGKVEGKLVGTIGIFIGMSGFSPDAVDALVAGKAINTILFDGDDIRAIAAGQFSIKKALDRKLRAAADSGTPFMPLRDEITHAVYPANQAPQTRLVIVEGRFDAQLVHALADELGPPTNPIEVLPAGGALNLAGLASAASAAGAELLTIIADGDGDASGIQQLISDRLDNFESMKLARPRIVVLDPTFEEALELDQGTFSKARLARDNQLLKIKLREANVSRIAEYSDQVSALLKALGLGRKL
jgi:hypothetical protein